MNLGHIILMNDLKPLMSDLIVKYGGLYGSCWWLIGKPTPILSVAHIDTMLPTPKSLIRRFGYISSPKGQGLGADDRAGVWLALQLLSRLSFGALFLDLEESGGIGAHNAASSPLLRRALSGKTKLLLEYDRQGKAEYVSYSPQPPDLHRLMQDAGFRLECGSFSDISILGPALRIASANISVGYQAEHTTEEILDVQALSWTVKAIGRLYKRIPFMNLAPTNFSWDQSNFWSGFEIDRFNWRKT